jgi:phosphomannomutase/phosphoglucomutase
MARAPRQTRTRTATDFGRLASVAASTLLFMGAGFCAWQGWLIADEGSATERVTASQASATQAVTQEVAHERKAVMSAFADPQLMSIVDDHAAAAAALRKRLPDASRIEVFDGTQEDVLHANYHEFGYAKAAQLMTAMSATDGAPMQSFSNGNGGVRMLSLVVPIRDADRVRAWAWLELPFAPVATAFESVDPGAGRLELRQGNEGPDLMLLAHGSTAAQQEKNATPVRGSAFWVTAALPRAYIVLPRLWPFAMMLALLCLAAAIGIPWMRSRPTAARPARADGDNDLTLSEVLRDLPPDPDAAPPPRKLPAPAVVAAAAPVADSEVDGNMFRAYDIRGVVGEKGLSAGFAILLGRAVGSVMIDRGLHEIVVGRDGRLSGPTLVEALTTGLRDAGINVIDIGAAATPLIYYAAFRFNTGCCVAVTGSHNPPDYNGFKIVIGGETLAEDAIRDLYHRIVEHRLADGGHGGMRHVDVAADYLERVTSDVQTERRLKIVIDCGNGIAGAIAPAVFEGIGCDVIPLYCDVDGSFPNHHPDPSEPKNLQDLILSVRQFDADLGLAFDGDGDRLGVVTKTGEIIFPDRLLMLFAQDVLSRNPGATIIYDVKCTGHMRPVIQEAAGVPLMWRTGHSLIKAKMRETEAALGGEMSGHFFFAERWYGFDDGVYAGARLLEILASDPEERTPQQIFDTLPKGVSTPELKIPMAEGASGPFIEALRARASFGDARMTTIDGVRADWPDGWGLVRASNTTPVLVLRFDADDKPALDRIKEVFREQLLAVEPGLSLPF